MVVEQFSPGAKQVDGIGVLANHGISNPQSPRLLFCWERVVRLDATETTISSNQTSFHRVMRPVVAIPDGTVILSTSKVDGLFKFSIHPSVGNGTI